MTEGLRRHHFLHTATAIILYFDNPTVLFAVRSQSTSPSEEVEAYGSSKVSLRLGHARVLTTAPGLSFITLAPLRYAPLPTKRRE